MKIANTVQLKKLNAIAVENEYNRCGTDELMDVLDPDGFHVLRLVVGFHNDQLHHRCLALCKVVDSEVPVTIFLDVDADMYEKLIDAAVYGPDK